MGKRAPADQAARPEVNRLAVVFYGKIANVVHRTFQPFSKPSSGLVALSYFAFKESVLEPAKASFDSIDVFGHSWSPETRELIDALHGAQDNCNGVIFNPGGYSHTSVALRDAVEAISIPTIEVHLSNIHAREGFRRTSLTASVAKACISGLGVQGYFAAIDEFSR